MCGRFDVHSAIEIIARIFSLASYDFIPQPNYNAAPSQDIAIVINDNGRRLVKARWGFVPFWSKDLATGYKMINARSDSVAVKRSFKSAFEKQRCLVVADGFFEWKKEGAIKKPYYIRLKSREPFGFAGLYSDWHSPEGGKIVTSTIITTDANSVLAPIHDRMPVIVPAKVIVDWLDTGPGQSDKLLALLKPYPSELMESYEVSLKVNSPKNNGPENIERKHQAPE